MLPLQVTGPNVQPPEKAASNPDGILEVHSCFYTAQGEGPFAGDPSVFVRLAGCNLCCDLCDTDYTSSRTRYLPKDLTALVLTTAPPDSMAWRTRPLVVVTGGEPFRQDFSEFVKELVVAGFDRIQIETNGTLYQDVPFLPLTVVCSPKTPRLNHDLLPRIDVLKYVLDARHVDPTDGLPSGTLGGSVPVARPWPGFKGTVIVQPADEKDEAMNAANMQAVLDSCMKFGYRAGSQHHKHWNLP